MIEKMKSAGAGLNEAQIKGNVNQLLSLIGKEKAQSAMSEADYLRIVKKMVADESGGDDNWDDAGWAIKDKAKCPNAALVKAELDKLDTKGEFGINQHENRLFWLECFSNMGEQKAMAQMAAVGKAFGFDPATVVASS